MFNEYDTFRLKKNLPDATIPIGALGVVLIVFDKPQIAYEVEFPDGKGGNIGLELTYTITEEFMDAVGGDSSNQAIVGQKE